ncbi:DNA cytosine methyltransferase [Caballeronia sp. LZ003]|uniref:DNA cytosine methyltransferase n=1 Tax=unclassified Caballeronia TaxID=2646786 RepID=UPI003857F520
MNELALFAGAGGGILGGHLLGWRTVCAVERDAYAAQVLAQRQNDGVLRPFPIWSDVTTFDGTAWRGIVEVISGGFPCQDISIAGNGAGLDGARSGLWVEMARIVCEVQPGVVLVENSPMLTSRGLGRVLGDLAEMGFDAEWGVISAADVGAPHLRERIWIVAYARGERYRIAAKALCARWNASKPRGEALAYADGDDQDGRRSAVQMGRLAIEREAPNDGDAGRVEWPVEPAVGRMANGVAHRVDRLTALGNGQVPRVAAAAFTLLAR